METKTFEYADESTAASLAREFEREGYTVSFVAFNPETGLYTFDVFNLFCPERLGDGNQDDPSYLYCGYVYGHDGEHGNWQY